MRRRADELFATHLDQVQVETSHFFVALFWVQWLCAIAAACLLSPYAWSGSVRSLHVHVQFAIFGGLALNCLPTLLIYLRPQGIGTRHVVAASQMLWSAILVHLTGGRIETHFHIFGSLAFLAYYRDPRILLTATAVVAADHLLLGFVDPLSVYGITNPEWWRFLEHAGWVVFEDVILLLGCRRQLREMHQLATREAAAESHTVDIERQVTARTAELRTSNERYRNLVENTHAIPWEIEAADSQILYIAPQIRSVVSDSGQELHASARFCDFLHPEDQAAFLDFIARAPDTSAPPYIDSRVGQRDGVIRYLRSFVPVGARGASVLFGISIDITSQRRLEMDLLQAQKLESIGQLAAGIAHEINTPIQFIGDNLRFLRDASTTLFSGLDQPARTTETASDPLSAEIAYLRTEVPRAVGQSLEGVERICGIVGAMKDFSHPALEKTPCDINRAIESAITVSRNEWKYVAELQTDLDPKLPTVSVMPGAFNQVMLNLIVNAAHAVGAVPREQRGEKGSIRISTHQVDSALEIRIADSGVGIPAEIRERIFDPFFTTKEVGKGSGQGLAIVHDAIVNKHGGTIAVDSTVGAGTTFVIRLPMGSRATMPRKCA